MKRKRSFPRDVPFFPRNNQYLREVKRGIILRYLLSGESFSQAELSKLLELNPSTTSIIVNELKEEKLIVETSLAASTPRGGKRPLLLGVNKDNVGIFALSLRTPKSNIFLLNLAGDVLMKSTITFKPEEVPERIPSCLSTRILSLKKRYLRSFPSFRILATGIVLEAMMNPDSGEILYSVGLRAKKFPFAEPIEKATGIPVFVENTVIAEALQEYWFGKAQGMQNFLYLKTFPAIRSVLFHNGSILYGANCIAGEIGASLGVVDQKNYAFLSDVLEHNIFGLPSLKAYLQEASEQVSPSSAYKDAKLLQSQQSLIEKNLDSFATILGQIICNLITYYDPKLILLGKIPRSLQNQALNTIKQEIARHLYMVSPEEYSILCTKKERNHIQLGILSMVMERFIDAKSSLS
ncbi:MAG: ROK family transcriptional regulator [Candidatus Ratteibacteria bacterium]|jgi:predicted NBD/HSP70 family sugar kinase